MGKRLIWTHSIQAINDFGVGERTETVSAATVGSAPVAPTGEGLITANATSIALDLSAWQTGGCAISSFVIEYLERGSPSTGWVLVNNNVKTETFGRQFPILDLKPETQYTLRVTAHNAAASTVHEYDFATLTYLGGTSLFSVKSERHYHFH
jgi:hypothetical protein